jgi:hypothetical protein
MRKWLFGLAVAASLVLSGYAANACPSGYIQCGSSCCPG